MKKCNIHNRMQLFWLYTVLFAVTLTLTFFPFLMSNTSLVFMADGFEQHYENLIHLKHVFQQLASEGTFPFWSWSIGLGADSIGSMVSMGYPLFDLFHLIAVVFPEKYMSAAYTLVIFCQLYGAGLGFLYFGKVTNMSLRHTLWGAFAYALSAWTITVAGAHPFFLDAVVILAFIMAGIEKVIRKQSPLVLIIAVAYSLITSLYFSYMTAIFVFLYLLIHFITREKKTIKNIFIYWGGYILYAGIALCIAAIVAISGIYALINTPKDGGMGLSLFHPISSYVNFFSFLIGEQTVFEHYSMIGIVPLFLLTLPSLFHRIYLRKATPAMITFLLSLIFLLFPFFNSMLNGFSYPMGRWCYAATFFYVWSSIQCLSEEKFDIRKYKTCIAVMLAFFGVMHIFAGRILFYINSEITTITAIVNLAFAYLFYWLLANEKEKKRLQSVIITIAVMCNIISVGFVWFFPGVSSSLDSYLKNGEIFDKLAYSTQRAGTEIVDNTFYRIDQVDYISSSNLTDARYTNISYRPSHVPPNETLVFDTRSVYVYLSSTPKYIFDFYKALGNSASTFKRMCTYGNDNRTRLDFLTGVKYFLGNNPKNSPPTGANEYAAYGFSTTDRSSLGVDILQNKYSIGLGCTFDSYITETEWLSLDYPDREQALMQCVILPDDTQTTLTHADFQSNLAGAKKASYHISESTNILAGGVSLKEKQTLQESGKIHVAQTNGTFTVHLDEDYTNYELYLIARNLNRDPASTNEMKYSATSIIDRLDRLRSRLKTEKDYGDRGSFIMSVTMGSIGKRAENATGNPQGFSDIKDYMINLGQYRADAKDIRVSFNTIGDYSYDSFEILAVPLSTYETSVETCINNAFDISVFSDNYVKGTVNTAEDSTMLYLSIPYHDGWKAYVDGTEVSTQQIDVTFTGIPISGAGNHTVELRYRPVGFEIGIVCFVVGLIACAGVGIWHKRNREKT